MNPFLRYIRTLIPEPAGGLSDGELLNRFCREQDETAFAALVVRHGNSVWAACRRLVDRDHDAEDIFQAVFLTLARKATTLRNRDGLPAWLHGVTRRMAANLRRQQRRRDRAETALIDRPTPPTEDVSWREVVSVLDDELGRMPEHYRSVLILCCLEGRSRDEAARQLRWTLGQVKGRLERARDLLRQRLSRRGIELGSLLLTATLSRSLRAGPSAALIDSAVKTATMSAAGAVVSANVAILSEGVLKAMFLTKIKVLTCGALILGLAGFGGVTLSENAATGQPVPAEKRNEVVPDAPSPEQEKLPPLTAKELKGKWRGSMNGKFGYVELTVTMDFDFGVTGNGPESRWAVDYTLPRRIVHAVGGDYPQGRQGRIEGQLHLLDDSESGGVLVQYHMADHSFRRVGQLKRGKGATLRLDITEQFQKFHPDHDHSPVEGLVLRRVFQEGPELKRAEPPKKLGRVPDPPAELRAILATWDATYRHQPEEKFRELDEAAAKLLKQYPKVDDQARIYFEVAHVAGQTGVAKQYERIEKYARKALELSRDPIQRGWAWMYLSCTAQDARAAKTFPERRRLAAEALLRNLTELLVQDLPAAAPELPPVTKPARIGEAPRPGKPSVEEWQRPQIEARREAEFVRDLVARRETALVQLRDLYRPSVHAAFADADGPDELRVLATARLNRPEAVESLLDFVTGPPPAKPEEVPGVKKVNGDLVLVATGSKHGLRFGDLLEVYRAGPVPVHVGRLKIVAVDENEVTGKLTPSPDQKVSVGDLVTRTTPTK